MTRLLSMLAPEMLLTAAACILFLLGCATSRSARRATPYVALLALVGAIALSFWNARIFPTADEPFTGSIHLDAMSHYVRILSGLVGVLLLLLAWPTNHEQTGNSALHFGLDAGEFYGLFLLSITGLFLVSIANDLIVLFLALELVSVPTYVMVSMSRPAIFAQEAGVKYFFLGAMSVALMLFGFSYLYGATGAIEFQRISSALRSGLQSGAAPVLTSWQKLAFLLIFAGLAYKMAAVPLHFYAGDVYEGAATPVTAFLSFVPKTGGFIALVRIIQIIGGDRFAMPGQITLLLAILAALTMFVGNALGLRQSNVKRVLAYSSIAHSGYMLVAVAAMPTAPGALQGVLFYLAAYGIMNAGAFGVLMLLPSRDGRGSAETFEDIAAQGRRHVVLGLAMAISCFSLIGIPLTVGFLGKVLLIRPAFAGGLFWLAVLLVVNAAISAAYYLRIVAVMFMRAEPVEVEPAERPTASVAGQFPVALAVSISAAATIAFGLLPPLAQELSRHAADSSRVQISVPDKLIASNQGD